MGKQLELEGEEDQNNDDYKMFGMILILWEWLDGGRRPGIGIYGGEY